MLTARDIMTADVVVIPPTYSVRTAIELLISEQISGLPVVDEKDRLVGIVTEFALLATAYDDSVTRDTVAQHMTSDVLTVDVDAPVRAVADMFIVHRVRRVPVMERGRVVGLISRRDVLKAVFEGATSSSIGGSPARA